MLGEGQFEPNLKLLEIAELHKLYEQSPGIFVEHVETDSGVYAYNGWQYNNSRNSYVYYTSSGDIRSKMHRISIRSLLKNGFSHCCKEMWIEAEFELLTDRKNTRILAYRIESDIGLTYRCEPGVPSGEQLSPEYRSCNSRLHSSDPKIRYMNSANVNIFYKTENGKGAERRITLKNLLNQGFPKRDIFKKASPAETPMNFRFYRYRYMVHCIRKKYGEEAIQKFINNFSTWPSDEEFVEMLKKVHDKIRKEDREYHHNFEEFAGPQCAEDRHIAERVHYDPYYLEKDAIFGGHTRKIKPTFPSD